jgi:heme/copper-type cytochrome/quinol oxidase subunit 3
MTSPARSLRNDGGNLRRFASRLRAVPQDRLALAQQPEVGDGYTFTTNEFFWFYYFMTGIHILHVFMGFGALTVAAYQLHSPERCSQETVETCATYWHMVDFLWVIIFALLYLMR